MHLAVSAELQIRFNPFTDERAGFIRAFGRKQFLLDDIGCAFPACQINRVARHEFIFSFLGILLGNPEKKDLPIRHNALEMRRSVVVPASVFHQAVKHEVQDLRFDLDRTAELLHVAEDPFLPTAGSFAASSLIRGLPEVPHQPRELVSLKQGEIKFADGALQEVKGLIHLF